jgi:hypothetical protein
MFQNRFLFLLPVLLTVALVLGGCTKHDDKDNQQIALGREDAEYMVLIAVDMSGSFADLMTRDGKGYEFTMRVADRYFRNSIGSNNRLIIAQLSATDRALLWDGTPVQLRQDFPSANEFRQFLLKKSHPAGSRIYDGIADAFDYVLSDPSVASGKTRTAVFVLSDFDDNFPNPEKSEKRVADSLKAFAKTNGVVGFYFLEHPRVPMWRDHLRKSGIKQWVCDSEIVAYPPLPSFE